MTTFIALTLYQHCDGGGNALRLSLDGRRPKWIPKSLIDDPEPVTRLIKIDGQNLQKGEFSIQTWKAEEAGFIADEDDTDDRQGELVL